MNIDTTSLIRDMGINAGLLAFLAALYGIVQSNAFHPDRAVRQARQTKLPWVMGLLFGVIGVLTMLAPLRMGEGVIVDTRLVVTGLAGAYLSPPAALVCATILGGYRISLGGVGAGPAIVGIVLTTLIGWLWQRYRPPFSAHFKNKALADGLWLSGLGVSLATGGMLAIQTLPSAIARSVTEQSWLAVLLVYPIGAILLGYLLDNTHKLRLREESLEQNAEQLQAMLSEARQAASVFMNSKDTIAILRPDGMILDVNPSYCAALGYAREELVGKPSTLMRIDEGGEMTFLRRVAQAIERNGRWQGELVRRRKNGESFVSEVTVEGLQDEDGKVRRWVSIGKDLTEQRRLEEVIAQFGNYDSLTGLPSRRLFSQELDTTLRGSPSPDHLLALCVLDIDQFKHLNEARGQPIADRYLRLLAQRLKQQVSSDDLIGRIGGDEFVVVLKHCRSTSEAIERLENVRQALAQTAVLEGHELRLTCSAGVTFYPDDSADADGLLRHADLALYAAKEQGKDRIAIFDVQQGQRSQARRESALQVEEALKRGEMELFFQPKVRITDARVIGAESLIRWRHPERGLLSPAAFLDDIAGTPVANKLDFWVLHAAFQAGETLASQGFPLPLSINLTVSTLIDSRLQLEVSQLLKQHPNLPAQFLEIELLETETFNDLSTVASVIQGLDTLGVQCSIDDFGTGYSSLTYLQRLPVQIMKIDQSFVRDMLVNERDRTLVRGIISLTRAFERQVVAEGVETLAHAEALCDMGCDTLQGYGIARPMPLTELGHWIRQWSPPSELHRFISTQPLHAFDAPLSRAL